MVKNFSKRNFLEESIFHSLFRNGRNTKIFDVYFWDWIGMVHIQFKSKNFSLSKYNEGKRCKREPFYIFNISMLTSWKTMQFYLLDRFNRLKINWWEINKFIFMTFSLLFWIICQKREASHLIRRLRNLEPHSLQ